MKISYAISVCNELDELKKLLSAIEVYLRDEDEIMVIYDTQNGTKEVLEYLNRINIEYEHEGINFHRIFFPLNNDFATFKNELKSHCTGNYIFFTDADEIPHPHLSLSLPQILENNDVDMVWVPRVNTVKGITQEDINQWKWNVNERGWINYPDYQSRICKNIPEIKWEGKVHEKLVGYKTFSYLPTEYSNLEAYVLFHEKDIERQRKQNQFYLQI